MGVREQQNSYINKIKSIEYEVIVAFLFLEIVTLSVRHV